MLRAIEFKDKRFRTKEDYNLLSPLTENTIILCHDHKLMDSLAEEILNTVNGKAEYNHYDCDDEDIWFFCYQGTNEIETLPTYEEYIYPMCIFKGSHKVWNDGKDEVYKMICNGRYGTYDGQWIDLHGEHWDYEAHNCIAEVNMHLKD